MHIRRIIRIVEPDQLEVQKRSAFRGNQAVRINVDEEYVEEEECEDVTLDGVTLVKCLQKTEIWERRTIWRRYRKPGWYGLTFRVEGEIREKLSERFIVAQWKRQDSNDSPFLAQRLDNGVFHITVQDDLPDNKDDECRVLIAKSPGDIEGALFSLAADGGYAPCMYESDSGRQESRIKVIGPDSGPPKVLPDPCVGWVDVVFFVNVGNRSNDEVRVYAALNRFATTDNLISVAKGHIYSRHSRGRGSKQYFKFGIYRHVYRDYGILPFAVYMDAYRRGDDSTDVFVDDPQAEERFRTLTAEIPTRECNIRPLGS